MRLYFWDWHKSEDIECVEGKLVSPFEDAQDEAKNDCYRSLNMAKAAAMRDLRERIKVAELEVDRLKTLRNRINLVNVDTVTVVTGIRGVEL